MNTAEFESVLKRAGASSVAYADMSPVEFAASRGLTTGVSIILTYDDPELARRPGPETPDPEFVKKYYDFCSRLDSMAGLGEEYLRAAGYRAEGCGYHKFFDSCDQPIDKSKRVTMCFQQKTAATRAGHGWIGRMGVLVTREYGPHVWLVTVLTDAPLPLPVAEPVTESKCPPNCRHCVEACPVGAITGQLWNVSTEREEFLDAVSCYTHRRARGEAGGLEPMCGLCLAACPLGK